MKKFIISLCLMAFLIAPFSVKAEITNEEVVAQIKAQIAELQIQLQIQLLLQKIAELKAQIAEILLAQSLQTATIQNQGAVINQQSETINQINQNTQQIVQNTSVSGCTNPSAKNYNSEATIDNNSCILYILGCMDSKAFNYKPSAEKPDNSCTYKGCMDSTALNYVPNATISSECKYQEIVWKRTNNSTMSMGGVLNYSQTSNAYFPDTICQFTTRGNLPDTITIQVDPTIYMDDIANPVLNLTAKIGDVSITKELKMLKHYNDYVYNYGEYEETPLISFDFPKSVFLSEDKRIYFTISASNGEFEDEGDFIKLEIQGNALQNQATCLDAAHIHY